VGLQIMQLVTVDHSQPSLICSCFRWNVPGSFSYLCKRLQTSYSYQRMLPFLWTWSPQSVALVATSLKAVFYW